MVAFFPAWNRQFDFPTDICHSNREEIAILLLLQMKDYRLFYIFVQSSPDPEVILKIE